MGDTVSRMQDRNRTGTVDVRSLSVRNTEQREWDVLCQPC